ncbi:hypothetical protein H2203_000707 [Taxawa tesnikishii (nom. ined.)]|nr:hypothetical protein H2203_000707 [Dothideales sp. JES 119]
MSPPSIPKFSDLPIDKDGPMLNAWGLYGKDDELGFLNRLTDDVVKEAAAEIKTGTRISLNWPLDAQNDIPFFGRQVFHKHVYQKAPRIVHDDTWSFNTQSSSQWDGLRHFAYQKAQRFYNNVTVEQISGPNATNVNGIGAWTEQGIVGRGVLLDWYAWMQEQGKPAHNAFEAGDIPLSDLKKVAEWEGVEFKFGDILIIRSGYMAQYAEKSRDELSALSKAMPPSFFGVEQSEEVLQWIWENFSAVAGDQPSFERWPSKQDYMMHEVLLAGWGCTIGELFDLEKLSQQCKKNALPRPPHPSRGTSAPASSAAVTTTARRISGLTLTSPPDRRPRLDNHFAITNSTVRIGSRARRQHALFHVRAEAQARYIGRQTPSVGQLVPPPDLRLTVLAHALRHGMYSDEGAAGERGGVL